MDAVKVLSKFIHLSWDTVKELLNAAFDLSLPMRKIDY